MKGLVTVWPNLLTTTGVRRELTWSDMFGHLSERVAFKGDRQHPGWSPSTFQGDKRGRDQVERCHALVLDVDGTWTLDGAEDGFGGFYGLIHTSKSHTLTQHRFRIVLPLTRPVSAEEYDGLWRRLDDRWPGRFDGNAKDPSRFWYLPGVLDDESPFAAVLLDGHPMDPDEWLERPEPVDQHHSEVPTFKPSTSVEERARRYLAKMDPAISGSGGHAATWAAALALHGFGLGEQQIFDMLRSEYNPRCSPPWSDKELRHKARQASQRANAPSGFIVGRDGPQDAFSGPDPYEHPSAAREASQGPPDVTMTVTGVSDITPDQPAWQRYGVRTMGQTMRAVWDACQPKADAPRCGSGHFLVDKLIGGYRREMITALAAQTSWGKSSWALAAVDEAHAHGQRVLLVSGEDAEVLYGKRMAARKSDISAIRLRDEKLTEDEMAKLMLAVNGAQDVPWFLDGRGRSAEFCARAIEAILAEEQYDLVIVDYLQTFSAKAQDRRNEVSKVGRLFSDAIKRGGASGLLLSQVKRTDGRRPKKEDIKESGDIENAAEHVLVGWVEESKDEDTQRLKRTRYLAVEKNKDGPVYIDPPIFLPFNDYTASFRKIESAQQAEAYEHEETAPPSNRDDGYRF